MSILCVAEYGVHCVPIIVIRRTEEINPVHWLGAEEQTGHTHTPSVPSGNNYENHAAMCVCVCVRV